jgi:hypothetical protein
VREKQDNYEIANPFFLFCLFFLLLISDLTRRRLQEEANLEATEVGIEMWFDRITSGVLRERMKKREREG